MHSQESWSRPQRYHARHLSTPQACWPTSRFATGGRHASAYQQAHRQQFSQSRAQGLRFRILSSRGSRMQLQKQSKSLPVRFQVANRRCRGGQATTIGRPLRLPTQYSYSPERQGSSAESNLAYQLIPCSFAQFNQAEAICLALPRCSGETGSAPVIAFSAQNH